MHTETATAAPLDFRVTKAAAARQCAADLIAIAAAGGDALYGPAACLQRAERSLAFAEWTEGMIARFPMAVQA